MNGQKGAYMSSVAAATRAGIAAAFLLGLGSAVTAQVSPALSQKSSDAAEIQSITESRGSARVIVLYGTPQGPARANIGTPAENIQAITGENHAVQDDILTSTIGAPSGLVGGTKGLARFDITPGFAITATAAEINALASDDRVVRIDIDRTGRPELLVSLPRIGMPNGYALGGTGNGQVVAVLDTGVETTHTFLTGQTIAEACFSTTQGTFGQVNGSLSLCPGGASSSTAPGSGANCNINWDGCEHGTHVAGISVGLNSAPLSGQPTNGAAKNGKLIAIKMYSEFNDTTDCTGVRPCVLFFFSDFIRALDHVFSIRNSLPGGAKVAAVNLSGGGGHFSPPNCDAASGSPAMKASIDNLRSVGIATIISAGNGSSRTQIGQPACISTAIAVAASRKDADIVASYTDISTQVAVFAPGGDFNVATGPILSSVPTGFNAAAFGFSCNYTGSVPATGGSYCHLAGTSMAAPTVAGVFAAIRTVCPTKTVDQILNALIATGTSITDNRSSGTVTKPRINVDLAIQNLACIAPPPPPQACTLASHLGDFNGDGRSDLMFRRSTDGLISQYLMNGFQFLAINVLGAVGTDRTLVAVADFNGDGRADMLFRRVSDGMLSLYLLNGPQILAAQELGAIGTDWELAGVADFNGDGRADMLFRRKSDGMLSLYLMNGFQILQAQLLGAVGNDFRVRGVADFNGDGRADILFRRESDGLVSLYLFNGFQMLGAQVLGAVGADFRLLGVGDFNGDGRADMLFRRTSDGMLSLYLLNGFQLLGAQLLGAVGTNFTLIGIGDLNGDGRADLLFRRNDGLLTAYLFNGFQLIAAQALGTIGLDWTLCYGQPPLSVAQVAGQ
jgi:sRNA-binding regulator protein Hfq